MLFLGQIFKQHGNAREGTIRCRRLVQCIGELGVADGVELVIHRGRTLNSGLTDVTGRDFSAANQVGKRYRVVSEVFGLLHDRFRLLFCFREIGETGIYEHEL